MSAQKALAGDTLRHFTRVGKHVSCSDFWCVSTEKVHNEAISPHLVLLEMHSAELPLAAVWIRALLFSDEIPVQSPCVSNLGVTDSIQQTFMRINPLMKGEKLMWIFTGPQHRGSFSCKYSRKKKKGTQTHHPIKKTSFAPYDNSVFLTEPHAHVIDPIFRVFLNFSNFFFLLTQI